MCARLAGDLAEDLQQGFVVLHHSGAVGINVTVCCSVEHMAVAVGSPQARSFRLRLKVGNDLRVHQPEGLIHLAQQLVAERRQEGAVECDVLVHEAVALFGKGHHLFH